MEDGSQRDDVVRAGRPKLSGFSIGAMVALVAQAFRLAYVVPYEVRQLRSPDPAQAEDGRDPEW